MDHNHCTVQGYEMRASTQIIWLAAVLLSALLLAACAQVSLLPDEAQIALADYIEQHADSGDRWRVESVDQISKSDLRSADDALGAAWCVDVEWADQPDERYLVYRFSDDLAWQATVLDEPDTPAAQAVAPLCQ
jgi:hypothetical protein